jgi:hypothetical protein
VSPVLWIVTYRESLLFVQISSSSMFFPVHLHFSNELWSPECWVRGYGDCSTSLIKL